MINNIAIITGGLGTTGSELVKYIIDNDRYNKIIIIDNGFKGKLENLGGYVDKVDYFIEDISNTARIDILVKDISKRYPESLIDIYNLAAIVETKYFYSDPELTYNINVQSSIEILKIALKYSNIKKFFNASTSEVYGRIIDEPLISEDSDSIFTSPIVTNRYSYAIGKLLTEYVMNDIVKKCGNRSDFKIVHARYANTYGLSDMDPEHIIPYLIDSIHNYYTKGARLTLTKDYNKKFRTFLNQIDSSRYTYEVMKNGNNYEVYNIGSPEEVNISDLVDIVNKKYCEIANTEIADLPIDCSIVRKGDPLRRKLDTKKLDSICSNNLGFVKLEDGISDMILKYLNNLNA